MHVICKIFIPFSKIVVFINNIFIVCGLNYNYYLQNYCYNCMYMYVYVTSSMIIIIINRGYKIKCIPNKIHPPPI